MTTLIINYHEEGTPCLIIEREIMRCLETRCIKATQVINTYRGDEAKNLYEQLINHTNKEEK